MKSLLLTILLSTSLQTFAYSISYNGGAALNIKINYSELSTRSGFNYKSGDDYKYAIATSTIHDIEPELVLSCSLKVMRLGNKNVYASKIIPAQRKVLSNDKSLKQLSIDFSFLDNAEIFFSDYQDIFTRGDGQCSAEIRLKYSILSEMLNTEDVFTDKTISGSIWKITNQENEHTDITKELLNLNPTDLRIRAIRSGTGPIVLQDELIRDDSCVWILEKEFPYEKVGTFMYYDFACGPYFNNPTF